MSPGLSPGLISLGLPLARPVPICWPSPGPLCRGLSAATCLPVTRDLSPGPNHRMCHPSFARTPVAQTLSLNPSDL